MRIERIGDAVLYLADCLDVLPTLPKVGAVITDPPYGLGMDAGGAQTFRKNGQKLRKAHAGAAWDVVPPASVWPALQAMSDVQIVWGGNYFPLPSSRGWLVWDKAQYGLDMSDGELAWTSMDRPLRIFNLHRIHLWNERPTHPTQKPLKLMEWCIEQAGGVGAVLDPFMGSGTTGVAAAGLGRPFLGIEREPSYFDMACERINNAHRQERMFA